MSGYRQLLDATITHLEAMHEAGTRFVPVSATALADLKTTATPVRKSGRPPSQSTPDAPVREARNPPMGAEALVAPPTSAVGGATRSIPAGAVARWNQSLRPASPSRPTATGTAATQTVPFPAPPPLPPKLDPASRKAAMDDLRQRALVCVRCPNLVASRQSVVFGTGDVQARLLFIGEAPGADEDRMGEPFVGAAGDTLNRIIKAMDLSREQVFIANVLKCRPNTPGQSSGNRKPTPEEMATCLPWLQEQIGIIQPEVMVALGATAVEGLLGKTANITRLRGQWQTYRGIPLMPTYHPAYLLYSGSLADKRKVWEDMLAVMERLSLPISARQRGFFLPKDSAGTGTD